MYLSKNFVVILFSVRSLNSSCKLFYLFVYIDLLKTGSLDNALGEFSSAKPSCYMSHYTMIYKNGERMRDFLGLFVSVFYILGAILIKQLFHSRLLDMR